MKKFNFKQNKSGIKEDKPEKLSKKHTKLRKFTKYLFIFLVVSITTLIFIFSEELTSKFDQNPEETNSEIQSTTLETQPIADKNIIISINSNVSLDIRNAVNSWEAEGYSTTVESHDLSPLNSNIIIERNITQVKDLEILWSKLYIPVTRFNAKIESIGAEELEDALHSQVLNDFSLIWDLNTDEFIKSKFKTVAGQQYSDISQIHKLLNENDNYIAIIPFNALQPMYKILNIDTSSPLDKTFNKTTYPLIDNYFINGSNSELTDDLSSFITSTIPSENYDRSKLHDVILTGTSVVGARTQYFTLDKRNDPAFCMRGVANTLKAADIAHLSNEGTFSDSCTQTEQTMQFCGKSSSLEAMTFAGIDIVGLTGNHILDYGHNTFTSTLDLYDENGIKYFGGGDNFDQAHEPLIVDIGDIKLAFLGYNLVPSNTWARTNSAGNAHPDFYTGDTKFMKFDIESAKSQADYVIVDMQWGAEYTHTSNKQQETYGRYAIDYGADVINGVHSHYTQGIEYYKDGLIFYGLGNFQFDQLSEEALRQGLMVRHVFYEDTYFGYELIPTYIGDNLQTVLAENSQKDKILNIVYENSFININE